MSFIRNARMYSVTPEVEAAWRSLLERVCAMAEVELSYMPYPAPQPLEVLWRRGDLGCVLMCGYPIALKLADVVPIAAPIPDADWAGGRPLYRTDLVVKADSRYGTLADTFGGALGWTVSHSHSGFNAPRHHLLGYRTPERPQLYARTLHGIISARGIVDEVLSGDVDVGPLDAYWHMLIRKHVPEMMAGVRIVETTALAPLPTFVASAGYPEANIARLKQAFAAAAGQPWFAPLAETLCVRGFAPMAQEDFAVTLDWDREAHAAGYPEPA